MEQKIYRTNKEEVLRKLQEVDTLVFDLDNTLVSFERGYPFLERSGSWTVSEYLAGLHNEEGFRELIEEYFKLIKIEGKEKELETVQSKLDAFWKGKSVERLKQGLFPAPYYNGVKEFFRRVRDSERKYFLAIISSGPSFFVEDIAKELGVDFWEACMCEVDDKGRLTGKFSSNGIYGKGKSLRELCRRFSRDLGRTVYHGDHDYDREALEAANIGIAFSPFGGLEGEVAKAADVVIYDWRQHPLLELL